MPSSSRRNFLGLIAGGCLAAFDALAAPERGRVRITDIKVMLLQGPRTYTLVKVLSDAGVYGIGEGFGSSAPGIKEAVLELRSYFIGKDPLQIDALCHGFGDRAPASLPALSAIEIALWDLAGKLLNQPVSTLLGGSYRDRVRVYRDDGPPNMLDRTNCNEWADKMKSDPAGWTAFKVEIPHPAPKSGKAVESSSRLLSTHELSEIHQGFEYLRDSIGWDYDLIVHCPGSYDLRSAIQLTEAIEPVKPLWIEAPLPDSTEAAARLAAASRVPIATPESLARRREFKDYILRQACDIVELDVRGTGGLLESKKIADLAELFYLPVAAYNTGSIISTISTIHLASVVRDFIAAGTLAGRRNWMDDLIRREGPVVVQGHLAVPQKPGLGIELNPDVVKANLAAGERYWE